MTINNSEYQDFGSVSKVVLAHMGEPALPYYAKAVLLPNTGAASMTVNPTHQSSHTIDTSGVADGFYLLKLANENSQDIRKIVIK